MNPKHEARAQAKKTMLDGKGNRPKGTAKVKADKAAPTRMASDFDDVADLFKAIKQTKAQQTPTHSHLQSAKGRSTASDEVADTKKKKGEESAKGAAKRVKDGLYHAPEKSVQMNDNQFFSGTWLKADTTSGSATSGSILAVSTAEGAEDSQELLTREGVDRIVSMDELSKMLSRNARAGTTPNCPFDCDCCF